MDETTDISSIEQLTFCVRYLDSDYQIKERFLGFYEVRMDFKLYLLKKIFNNIFVILSIALTNGEQLTEQILNIMKRHGLAYKEYLVGQGYDGGANMSGCHKGVSARILNVCPSAMYVFFNIYFI